jgi:HEAT repeat protein
MSKLCKETAPIAVTPYKQSVPQPWGGIGFMRTLIVVGVGLVLGTAAAGRAAPPKKEDVPRYIKQLQTSGSARVRAEAAEALGYRGAIRKADVVEAVSPLIQALKSDRDANVRKSAATALGKIAPDDNAAVKPLAEALKDKSVGVRIAAANALGLLGSDAKEAVPALREVQKEIGKDRKMRNLARAVNMAIRSIQGKNRK